MTSGDLATYTLMTLAVGCAVVTTVVRIKGVDRQAGPAATNPRAPTLADTARLANWQTYIASGHRMGPPTAKVTILEFADFECPVCRRFTNGALKYVRAKYPNDVQVVFRHWPLKYHKFAYPAARAAECASDQGRFEAFHDLIYAKQDSLGLKSFAAFAKDAGVRDSATFAKCAAATGALAVVTTDSTAARQVGGRGTPTVVINGLRLAGAPDSAVLERLVQEALRR